MKLLLKKVYLLQLIFIKGNCDFFYDKKNCYIIKGTDEIEVVIEKRNNRYKIIAIRVLTV